MNDNADTGLDLLVTSQPPEQAVEGDVDPSLLALFRSVIRSTGALPYTHQAETFTHVRSDHEVALVAGTAAGKTFAIALPILAKACTLDRVRKVVFMYPTRALLADQRRVLGAVVAALGCPEDTIGEIRGGMTSAQLIRALSKRVIVATPDALFWFFRKNVKFTMALIYGLAQAEEIVLDEAHLYNGLMLRNMRHFLDRLRHYRREYFEEPLRVHYLTATANQALQELSPSAVEVRGRSKCTQVTLHLRPAERPERNARLEETMTEALRLGGKRILVVANSARMVHQLFLTHGVPLSNGGQRAVVPDWFWLQFGSVEAGSVLDWLCTRAPEVESVVRRKLIESLTFRTSNLEKATVWLRAEYLGELVGRTIEHDVRSVRRVLERYRRQYGERIESGKLGVLLSKARGDAGLIAQRLGLRPTDYESVAPALEALERRGDQITEALQAAIDAADQVQAGALHGGILLTGDAQAALADLFAQAGLSGDLRRHVAASMVRSLVLDRETIESWEHLDPAMYQKRLVNLGRLVSWIEDESLSKEAATRLMEQAARHSGIGLARNLPGEPLLILYSGSMARYTREGLIEAFTTATTDRPVILLSTSAVEVGVDFAADMLITEECEGSSFLQRLGRVGRRVEIEAVGWVLLEPATLGYIAADLGGETTISRDRLATLIVKHFPIRAFLGASRYVDALQLLVTRQLGRTGRRLGTAAEPEVAALADTITAAGIAVDYGLRGTMPAVSLQDAGVSKDPFYILRFVEDRDVMPAASPFEVATLARSFNSLVFAKSWRAIFVHLEKSLERCVALAVPTTNGARILAHLPNGENPITVYMEAYNVIDQLEEDLRYLAEAALATRFPSLPPGISLVPHQLLVYGPLVLAYTDFADPEGARMVLDQQGGRIELPDQWYLVLRPTGGAEDPWTVAENAGVLGFENEVHYDTEAPRSQWDSGIVLLDEQAGAVWEIWESLQRQEVPA